MNTITEKKDIVEIRLKVSKRLYDMIKQSARTDGMSVEEWAVQEMGSGVISVVDRAGELPGLLDFDEKEAVELFEKACPNSPISFG